MTDCNVCHEGCVVAGGEGAQKKTWHHFYNPVQNDF